ncbi:MAG TPA: trypsin-like peptidase domain-containing protein [Thermoanaerobaculia bacterium]|nr:trypsin-like peptidase domain-containing protein [Thermoanaerobaculia bacterium]
MTPSTKRILSTIAIAIASVAFGVIISADLGLMRNSHAQPAQIATAQGPVTSVTIPSFADVAARVMPAVVSIRSTEIVKTSDLRKRGQGGFDPFEFFFPNPNQTPRRRGQGQDNSDDDDEHAQRSGGSGFIISPDGYILTNNHVIEGATKVEVHYGADENGNGGHTVEAKIVGHDPATDIALLKIDPGNGTLPNIALGDSDHIRKGDWAIAVGNPFEFENTLTVGVISAKGRSLGLSQETRSFENFIQTDAAINFGNSGGPLIGIDGQVIGINTAIRGGGAQGIGFATPINTAKRLLPQLKQGKITRGYLGMQIYEVTEDVKQSFNLPDAKGALVQAIEPGKPADKAGIQAGDVITEIDGRKINNNRELIDYISYLPVGSKVNITLIRNGQRKTVTATTAQRPDEAEPSEETQSENGSPTKNRLGVSVQEITPQSRQQYGLGENLRGIVVTGVKEVSPAGDAGITEGDVISEVQGQKINTLADFRAAVDGLKSGQTIRVYVTTSGGRGGQSLSGYRFLRIP